MLDELHALRDEALVNWPLPTAPPAWTSGASTTWARRASSRPSCAAWAAYRRPSDRASGQAGQRDQSGAGRRPAAERAEAVQAPRRAAHALQAEAVDVTLPALPVTLARCTSSAAPSARSSTSSPPWASRWSKGRRSSGIATTSRCSTSPRIIRPATSGTPTTSPIPRAWARCSCARTPRPTRRASWSRRGRRCAWSCPARSTATRPPTPPTRRCSTRSRAWPWTKASPSPT